VDLLAAARRFAGLLGAIAAIVALLSLLGGLALGSGAAHAVVTGFYVVGAFLLVVGVFAGVRGPLRPKAGEEDGRDAVGGLFGIGIFSRGIRTATVEERRDSRSTTWLFFTLGLCLILLGVLVDGRATLLP
jgi:hypothetical protein